MGSIGRMTSPVKAPLVFIYRCFCAIEAKPTLAFQPRVLTGRRAGCPVLCRRHDRE